ncbi:MAG: DUF2325 domain-containing protein [Methylotenera sp.]
MSSVLIVGGDQVDGIREVFGSYDIDQISHWSGRKAGDSNKVIPQNTRVIVLITKWINHSITYKLKRDAVRRGIKVIYTPSASRERLTEIIQDNALAASIRHAYKQSSQRDTP